MDEETLRSLAQANREARDRSDAAHAVLVGAIWQAHDEGWRQTDIVSAAGITRERVRQLCDPKYRGGAPGKKVRKLLGGERGAACEPVELTPAERQRAIDDWATREPDGSPRKGPVSHIGRDEPSSTARAAIRNLPTMR